ncbi:hypothetical protein ACFW04_005300 [Cataglyphis niger]
MAVPTSSPQQQQQQHHRQPQHHQQHHHSTHRQPETSPPSVGISPFVLPASMTQTPSMHLLENNNLVEVAMAQQQQQQQSQQQLIQKQKQTSPTNNNTIEAWRSIQGGHQWWSSSASVHQEQQQQPSIAQVSQSPSLVVGSVCGQMQRPQVQSEIDQPLDFSVGSLQQQRLHSRVRTIHERHQGRMHDNNNGTISNQKIIRGDISRRSYSPSEASTSSSEDEAVSTSASPSGPLRGASGIVWIVRPPIARKPIYLKRICKISPSAVYVKVEERKILIKMNWRSNPPRVRNIIFTQSVSINCDMRRDKLKINNVDVIVNVR